MVQQSASARYDQLNQTQVVTHNKKIKYSATVPEIVTSAISTFHYHTSAVAMM
jgi:hypothetical protein